MAGGVFAEARRQGMAMRVEGVEPIATSEYPTPARRPANSELNCDRVASIFGITIRPWRHSLARVIADLGRRETGDGG